MKKTVIALAALTVMMLAGCGGDKTKDFGVFMGFSGDLSELSDYETIVIDAQYYDKDEIESFKAGGGKVYSYINIGSIEEFRDYYDSYKDLSLSEYENWEGEYWIDVSDEGWRRFNKEVIIPLLLEKGVDGFFVDNCDVYYLYPTQEIMDGLTDMMTAMVGTGKAVLINSGNEYLDDYCEDGGDWEDVITGICQESVFSRILWDEDRFGEALPEDREYFMEYIEKYGAQGADVYLIEYTDSDELVKKVDKYCREKGFHYYISDSLALD
jgi:hypothetical protein